MYVVLDTETTGMDHEEDKILELACVRSDDTFDHTLVDVGDTKISFGAMSAHHITPEMLVGAPSLDSALDMLDGAEYLTAHNVKFDSGFFPPEWRLKKWVCTYRCMMHLFPDAESHSNGALWFQLGLNRQLPEEAGSAPHRALFDSFMTHDLLLWMLEHVSVNMTEVPESERMEYLHLLTQEPILIKVCQIGKNRGALWEDVDSGFMNWILKNDFDEDTRFTCIHHLKKRGRYNG